MSLAATYRLGLHLFWRDRAMLAGSVVTPVAIAVGIPLLMRNVRADGIAAATDSFYGSTALLLSITAFMNLAVVLTGRRDQLVLKRLRSTRLTDAQILVGEIASTVTATLGLLLACLLAVHAAADVPLPPDPVAFAGFAFLGALTMAVLGAAWTAAIPRAELAAAMTVPVFLLCGVGAGAMGPIAALLPSWAGVLFDLLPTTAAARAMRTGEVAGPLVNLALWLAAGLGALRLWFRWEPRRS
ncbi:ABC transporter permease [Nonomuraea longicatena]|uniref:ABC transporter permease n=1 Tax=Nonomuraea longicatena TaxID=83682 RepID=A0ABP4B492_9ACTN